MNRDQSIAHFEKYEAIRKAALDAGKSDDEAHEITKVEWNKWAEGLLAERAKLEEQGLWQPEKDVFGNIAGGKNQETKNWFDQANMDFTSLCFLIPEAELKQEAQGSENKDQANTEDVKTVKCHGPSISFDSFIFPGNADFRSSQFTGDASFSSSHFMGDADFSSSQFTRAAYFSSSQFTGAASFRSSHFTGKASFRSSHFTGNAYFSSSQFTGNASFRSSLFTGDADFSSSQFTGNAYFSSSQFTGAASFRSSQFTGDADFSSSKFTGYADFRSSQFTGAASFRSSQFTGEAYFNSSQFTGAANFSSSQFTGAAYFRSSQFTGAAYFRSSQFTGDANFESSQFRKSVSFLQATFEKLTIFKNSEFHDTADFASVHGKRSFDMADVTFHAKVPSFIQADFTQAPRLDNVSVPVIHFLKSIYSCPDREDIARYRSLRRLAIDAHDHERERMFFKGEMRAKRGTEEKFLRPSWWFSLFYDFASDYGQAVIRPFLLWISLIPLFGWVYWCAATTSSCNDGFIKGSYLAFQNALIFFSANRRREISDAYNCLYGNGQELPSLLGFLGGANAIASAILLFLILLGLRNMFKIK